MLGICATLMVTRQDWFLFFSCAIDCFGLGGVLKPFLRKYQCKRLKAFGTALEVVDAITASGLKNTNAYCPELIDIDAEDAFIPGKVKSKGQQYG